MWIAISNAIGSRQGVGGGPGPSPGYTPPLDTYTGATAAYSVRKLSSSYSGPCIEAYRVSDGATQDIGFDGDGLIDTAAIISFAAGSEVRVQTWYDQSSNALDAVQTASANMARIYDGSSIYEDNGNPAVDFNNNQFFSIGSSQWTDGAMMASIVFSRRSGNDTYWTSNGSVWRLFYESAVHGFVHYGTTPVSTKKFAPPGSAPVLTTARFGGGSADLYENGNSVGSSPTVTGSMSTASGGAFMGQRSDGALRMDGTIQELIHWGSDQTSNRTGVESNINEYFQITNLPDYTSGLLADYPGAAAAYSVRALSNTAIKCMRVRRTVSPFDEQDIGFDSNGDLDTAAISAFGGSDPLTVSAWYDQSGQSRHAAQVNATLQPQVYDGAAVVSENGKPAVRTVGQTQYLNFLAVSIDAAGGYTTFAAKGSQTDWGNVVTGGPFIRSTNQLQMRGGSLGGTQMYAKIGGGIPNLFGRFVLTGRKNNATYDMYMDTTLQDSRTVSSPIGSTFGQLLRGVGFDPNSLPDNGFCHEVIIYPTALSDTDVTAIQNNLITEFY